MTVINQKTMNPSPASTKEGVSGSGSSASSAFSVFDRATFVRATSTDATHARLWTKAYEEQDEIETEP